LSTKSHCHDSEAFRIEATNTDLIDVPKQAILTMERPVKIIHKHVNGQRVIRCGKGTHKNLFVLLLKELSV